MNSKIEKTRILCLTTFPRTDTNQKGVGWGSKMSAQVSKNDHINGKIQLLFNNGMSVLKDSGIKGIKGRATFS